MQQYAQLNESLTEAIQVTTHGNVEWDANNYCSAAALVKDGRADQFRVVPLTATEAPSIDPLTQTVIRDGCEQVNGEWRYKWRVDALTAEQITAKLAALKASKVTAIKAERDRRKFNGVKVGTKWIHTDTYSRTQWMGMVMMGAGVPAIEWTTMDGSTTTTSQSLAAQVFQGTVTLDATLFAYAKGLIAAVDASTDPASVDITTGWPATFEG